MYEWHHYRTASGNPFCVFRCKMSEIYERIVAQYGEHCIAEKNVHGRLKCGKTMLNNDE